MLSMKPLTFIIAPFLLLWISGCVVDDTQDNQGNADNQELRAKDFVPHAISQAVYTWQVHVDDMANGTKVDYATTETISYDETRDGQEYFTSVLAVPQREHHLMMSDSENGIFYLADQSYFDNHILGTSENSALGRYYKVLNFSLPQDVSADVLEGGTETEDLYCNFSIETTFTGQPAVTVPAGTFNHCPRFVTISTVGFTHRITGSDPLDHFSRRETVWFGEKTGPVKRVTEWLVNDILVMKVSQELVSLTVTNR
jgi:hypothetical protein